jgi:DNA-binding beta-propeller fold protein YncE
VRFYAFILAMLTGGLAFAQSDAGSPPALRIHMLALLPSAPGRIGMDYLGYEPRTNQVWVPGANTGRVFVVDGETEAVRSVEGFPTREKDGRVLGPTSVTFGPGHAFIGNRADASVCAVDLQTLQRRPCVTLPDTPDGLAYVASTKEVWATTPRSKALVILSPEKGLVVQARVQFDGEPEGYAVDDKRGRFYTNLEDKNETLAIDVRARKLAGRWPTGCSADGPRGMTVDARAGLLVVACTDRLVSFVLGPKPELRSSLETGAGVDNIDLAVESGTVFAAAGKAERLTRGHLAEDGTLSLTGQAHTSQGVRVVVVTASGKAFAGDGARGALWVSSP